MFFSAISAPPRDMSDFARQAGCLPHLFGCEKALAIQFVAVFAQERKQIVVRKQIGLVPPEFFGREDSMSRDGGDHRRSRDSILGIIGVGGAHEYLPRVR